MPIISKNSRILSANGRIIAPLAPQYFSYDLDAFAFFIAAGITDITQKSAINTLVLDFKGFGIWTKMKAIYPFVGGTAASHKWNLKDPRDLDAAFRIVFTGSFTHDSNGATPLIGNHNGNTFLVPNTALNRYSAHCSFYSRSNISESATELGPTSWQISIRYANVFYAGINNPSGVGTANTDSKGYYIVSRESNSVFRMYRNNTRLVNSTQTTTTNEVNPIRLFCFTPTTYMSTKNCAFASIGDGLTNIEVANMYTAVQAYQTTLSRNV